MSFFDNPWCNLFRLLLNLKQVEPTLPEQLHCTIKQASVSTPTSGLVTQGPALPSPTRPLTLEYAAKITRQLTSSLAIVTEGPSVPRAPLVIKSETKKLTLEAASLPPAEQQKRQRVVRLAGMVFLLLLLICTFLTATPLGYDVGFNFQPLQFSGSLLRYVRSDNNFIAQALYHQQSHGFNPFYYGNQIFTTNRSSIDWPLGECTYWANLRYHALTGYWVPWNGNAAEWVASARATPGWHVSRTPQVPSIMVLMPGVQGAGGYGHVAVVEGINEDGSVRTSNMNWYSNGGGFDRISGADFIPGPGVYFLTHD